MVRVSSGLWDSTKPADVVAPRNPTPRARKYGLHVDIGRRVDIFGLKGAAQYNGHEGRVAAGPNEKGRWLVHLVYQNDVKELALLEENLQAKPSCGWELVAAGLPMTTIERDISVAFSRYGLVQHVKVTRDENGVSKGVALIVMAHKGPAEMALGMHEVEIRGVGVKLQWSTMVKTEMGLMKNRDEEAGAEAPVARRQFRESGADEGGRGQQGAANSSADIAKVNAADRVAFRCGQAVCVSGLQGAAELNGCTGTVRGPPRDDGRYEVEVRAPEGSRVVALRGGNLAADAGRGSPSGGGSEPPAQTASHRRRFSEG